MLLHLFGSLVVAKSMNEAREIWKYMVLIINSYSFTDRVRKAVEMLSQEKMDEVPENSTEFKGPRDETNITIREASPFKDYFEEIIPDHRDIDEACEDNPHYSPKAIHMILKKWLALFGFRGGCALETRSHATNMDVYIQGQGQGPGTS